MVNNKQLVALAAALLAQDALALNVHRHGHRHNKKDFVYQETDIVTVTDWTTVTVYDDGTTPSATPSVTKPFFKAGGHTVAWPSPSSSSVAISSSSTVSPVLPSTTSTSASSTSSLPLPTPSTSSSSTPSLVYVPSTTLATSTLAAPTVYTPSVSTAVATTSSAAALEANLLDIFSPAAAATTSTSATVAAAAVVPTASASSSSSTSASTSSGGSKRGLAYNDGSLLDLFLNDGSKCNWSYNWGQTADSGAPSGLEFVPMLWGPTSSFTSTWADAAEAAIASGSTYLLSFNECDNAGQCNTDAATAAAAHQQYFAAYKDSASIGTPAITNSQNTGEGVSWLSSFLESCGSDCYYDFCPIHWYNTPDTADFLNHVLEAYEVCGKPIWVTEWAPTGASDDEINSFVAEIVDQLDNNSTFSFVDRYSYFMVETGSLLTSSSALSTYGQTYAYN